MILYLTVGIIISAIWTSQIYIDEPWPKGSMIGYAGVFIMAVMLWPVICVAWLVTFLINYGG